MDEPEVIGKPIVVHDTPDPNDEQREEIKEAVEEVKETIEEVKENAEDMDREEVQEKIEEIKEEVEEIKETIEEAKEASEDLPEYKENEGEDEDEDDGYWQQVAKDAEEAVQPEVSVKPREERQEEAKVDSDNEDNEEEKEEMVNYWQQVVNSEEDVTPNVEIVVTAAANDDDEDKGVDISVETSVSVQDRVEEINEKVEEVQEESKAATEVTEPTVTELEVKEETVAAIVQATAEASEKNASNIEVLSKLADEVDEDDKNTVFRMLAWAKASKKKKTDTFVIRAKKKEDSIRRAVDFNSMNIIIDDKSKKEKDGSTTIKTEKRKFQVTGAEKKTFQVRKSSVIQPVSETIVTKDWVTNAIKSSEQETQVTIEEMKFDTKAGGTTYEAYVKARVGANAVAKEYRWIIKEAPKASINYDARDKDIYLVSDLGCKVAKFVASKKLKKRLTIPFQPVIMADHQFAIFDNIEEYKTYTNEEGLDLAHMKQALKALGKLHAMTYAYFQRGDADVKGFSEILKVMIDKNFQPSASASDKQEAIDILAKGFDNLMALIKNVGADGAEVAEKARKKFGDRLYAICKDANVSTSKFSVLCHGNPAPSNLKFLYSEDQRPIDVKLVGFQQARYANAVTDIQLMLCIGMSAKIEEQTEFLLRFVYYENLAGTLKSLGVDPKVIEYETLWKEFKKKQVYGCLMGAMYLAGSNITSTSSNPVMNARRATGKRVFESKLVGRIGGLPQQPAKAPAKSTQEVSSAPSVRAKALVLKALTA